MPTYDGNEGSNLDNMETNGYDHFVQPYHLSDSVNGNGFTMVSADNIDKQKWSTNFKLKAELFDNLSSNSEIDHPLCEECADSILDIMDKELNIANEELQQYKMYLEKIQLQQQNSNQQHNDHTNISQLEKELAEIKLSEQKLLNELAAIKEEQAALNRALELEQEEKRNLQEQEASYWREYTKHRRELMLTEDDKRSLECQIAYAEEQSEKLKNANIFNVTFHIWHAGHFGTINNFRLGRLPTASVDWSEINAAWGQTVLLLCALARKINLEFKRYRIVPFGNHSYIEVIGENKELPLYGTGGFKFFWDTKFDAAMVAFIDCLTQFQQEVEKRDPKFLLPYKMEKGKIFDPSTGNSYSIKYMFVKYNSKSNSPFSVLIFSCFFFFD